MRELDPSDEKRLDSVQWLQGASLRGVQIDTHSRDVAIFAVVGEFRVELLCEDVGYLALPNLFDLAGAPRVVGLVAQPLDDAMVVRLEFSDHPSQIHLRCQRLVVRKDPAGGG
jgi:hypothetical protein